MQTRPARSLDDRRYENVHDGASTQRACIPCPLCPARRGDRGRAAGRGGARPAAAERRIDALATPPDRRRSARGAAGSAASRISCTNIRLSTKEGLALMVLAEALLRVPDAATADRLIEDKLAAGDCRRHERQVATPSWSRPRPGRSASRPASSSRGETPEGILRSLVKRLGLPAVRAATRQAMRLLGLAFRARPDHRGGAARAPRAHRRVPLFLRHAGRGRAHRRRRRALFRRLCGRDRGDRRAPPATRRCPTGPASRSSSRRCIRATRRSRASACWPSWCRGCSSSPARRAATTSTSPSTPRRPTGSNFARRHRRGARRPLARRLGRLRPRGAGLSEARAGGDRLARRTRRARSTAA